MKVQDLLEELEGLDPQSELCFNLYVGCCDQYIELDCSDIAGHSDYNIIQFDLHGDLPGLRSCKQMSMTKVDDKKYWNHYGKDVT